MKNPYKKIDNEEALLEDNDNFLSLEELAEEQFPSEENDIFSGMQREFSDRVLEKYFKEVYGSNRNREIARKFYGVGQESKNLTDLANEYGISNERVRQIVSRPLTRAWRSDTIKILNLIKSDELNTFNERNVLKELK